MYKVFIEDVVSHEKEIIGGAETKGLDEILPIIYKYLEDNDIYRSHLFHKETRRGNEKMIIRLNDSKLYFVVEELLN